MLARTGSSGLFAPFCPLVFLLSPHQSGRWLVGAVGVEPTTNGLKGRCSATELRPFGSQHFIRKRHAGERPLAPRRPPRPKIISGLPLGLDAISALLDLANPGFPEYPGAGNLRIQGRGRFGGFFRGEESNRAEARRLGLQARI